MRHSKTLLYCIGIFIASMFNNELLFYGFRVLLENNIIKLTPVCRYQKETRHHQQVPGGGERKYFRDFVCVIWFILFSTFFSL